MCCEETTAINDNQNKEEETTSQWIPPEAFGDLDHSTFAMEM